MPKFRKKPVVINAEQLTNENAEALLRFVDGRPRIRLVTVPDSMPSELSHAEVDTLEGTMRADYGDWLIQGIQGEIYPCKPDIFAATYEPA
jgi:FtsZ-interacting cell division protein YlmF